MQLKIIIASFLLLIGIIIYAVWSGSQVNSDSINNCHETLTTIKKRATEGDAIAQATLNFMRKKIGDGSDSSLLKYMANSTELAQRGNTEADILNQLLEVASGQRLWEDIDKQPLTKALLQNSDHTNPEQQFQLGVLYHQMHDYPEALKWLELSAEQGNVGAQALLGSMYYSGEEIQQNYKQALQFYEHAAEQGDPNAQAMLGVMYRDGNGVKIDYAESQKWLELAATQLDTPELWAQLGAYYFNSDNFFLEVETDYEKGYYWLKKAADSGNAEAQNYLGVINFVGIYVEKNYKEAYKWYKLAENSGCHKAYIDLGYMYQNGYYVEKNISKALEYYKMSAKFGDYSAYYMIGTIYEKGTEVEKDIPKAKEYYQKGAALGEQDAINALSRLSTDTESLDK